VNLTEPHVRINRLDVHREGRSVLQALDLSVDRGSFVAVEGRSGAGKTSLLACLAGMLKPAGGEISYRCQGGCEHTPSGFRRRLGCVFQHLMLTLNATVETNVLCGLLGQRPAWRTFFGFPAEDRRQARELLARLGLAHLADQPVNKLSGGERQRVAVARALIARPECLLADEPVSSLNPELAREVLALLKEECANSGCTVICALHDAALTEEFSDARLRLDGSGRWEFSARDRTALPA
jgi:phosphonate transport system ATP-binding protein